jgi:hypothetical protein
MRALASEGNQKPADEIPRGLKLFSHLLLMYGLKPVPFTGLNTLHEKDEPQPQERVEFGLIKLNPCRISVSS